MNSVESPRSATMCRHVQIEARPVFSSAAFVLAVPEESHALLEALCLEAADESVWNALPLPLASVGAIRQVLAGSIAMAGPLISCRAIELQASNEWCLENFFGFSLVERHKGPNLLLLPGPHACWSTA